MPARFVLFATALLLAGIEAAGARERLDVSLDVTREISDFRYEDDLRVENRYTRLGASIRQREIRWFQPGLTGGVGWASQSGDPATEGYSLSGHWAGLDARSEWPLAGGLSLIGEVAWIYNQVEGTEAGDTVEATWYETRARAGLVGRVDRFIPEGGAIWQDIDGERRRPGRETSRFEADRATGAYAGAALRLDRTGRVGVYAQTGGRRALEVRFSRRF